MAFEPVTDDTFREAVLASDRDVIVKFEASWCAPCKAMQPKLDELAAEFGSRVTFLSADVEKAPFFAGEYGIRQVPMLLFFRQGRMVMQRGESSTPKSVLAGLIETTFR